MDAIQWILIILIALFVVSAPFFSLRFLVSCGKFVFSVIFFPISLFNYYRKRKRAKERRQNYEILGNYIALLGNTPSALQYFRNLIEEGVSPERLTELLEINVRRLMDFEETKSKEQIRQELEKQKAFKELASEQQELLLQSRLSLEQMKFKEKLLDHLYQKIEKKYRI